MPVRQLVQLNPSDLTDGRARDSILGSTAEPVAEFNDELQAVVDDLLDTMFAHPVAIGLAAPQIGVPLKVAVINLERDAPENSLILVNPKILTTSGKKDVKRESCMSLPHVAGAVERRSKVSVQFQTVAGKKTHRQAEGFLARAIQHEVDHLEGKLYTEAMEPGSPLESVDFFDYPQPSLGE